MRAAAGGTGDELGAESLHSASKKLDHVQAGTEPTRKRPPVHAGKYELSWERGWQWEETVIQPTKGQGKFRGQSSEVSQWLKEAPLR